MTESLEAISNHNEFKKFEQFENNTENTFNDCGDEKKNDLKQNGIDTNDVNQLFELINKLNEPCKDQYDSIGQFINDCNNNKEMNGNEHYNIDEQIAQSINQVGNEVKSNQDEFVNVNNTINETSNNHDLITNELDKVKINNGSDEFGQSNDLSLNGSLNENHDNAEKTQSNGQSISENNHSQQVNNHHRVSHLPVKLSNSALASSVPSNSSQKPVSKLNNQNPTKIPRMSGIPKAVVSSNLPQPTTNSTKTEISNSVTPSALNLDKTFIKETDNKNTSSHINSSSTTHVSQLRAPRSISKSSGINSAPIEKTQNYNNSNIQDEANNYTNNNVSNNVSNVNKPKRGLSLSSSTTKSTRSISVNGDNETSRENLNEPQFNSDGTRNVKYIVRHKPKESKVKIFSQKVTITNVSSKIGSLENYDHKPTGGNVQIETKTLNWNAQSKIGSLEKATYVPGGGNVKIENRKLNWSAQSKIGSLEYANHQPKGGNIKIENHKLNFKEKAKPKTDTGLIVIESPSPNDDRLSLKSRSTETIKSFTQTAELNV